jgi:hypothetical protein
VALGLLSAKMASCLLIIFNGQLAIWLFVTAILTTAGYFYNGYFKLPPPAPPSPFCVLITAMHHILYAHNRHLRWVCPLRPFVTKCPFSMCPLPLGATAPAGPPCFDPPFVARSCCSVRYNTSLYRSILYRRINRDAQSYLRS